MSKKVLVACFSATGTTAAVASRLASAIQADYFEITPTMPYTEEDLDWNDPRSRSSQEMNGLGVRPPRIRSKVENMAQYEVVFVGFPIWWYREPAIVDTFMESYNFFGKILIPFATSGGSGMGECAQNFRRLAPGAARVDVGCRFRPDVTEAELADWASRWL